MADRNPRRAVFLDRDGTLCEEVGYLNHISRLHIFPSAAGAVRRLNAAGFPVIVVTNQSGVARGIFPESLIAQVHERIQHDLAVSGARIDGFYFCPHRREDACKCRKPLTGLLERAAHAHALELRGSWFVGDRGADIELAHNAGGRGVLVLTGYGRGEQQFHMPKWPHQPEFVAEDLAAAVAQILQREAAGAPRKHRSGPHAVPNEGKPRAKQ
ncbi:MAG TPA: HAD family hydrolase [Candidatus Acidoferrales bacterium]|nr:HAD family hydrolase [Candidatus Acidoferrales bacterium]